MEAFSDGVIAILITIMVFNIKAPEASDWAALKTVVPSLLSFLLSFVYLGIFWNNHHHLLQLTHRVDGKVLLANLHLLFWLSLIPFSTAWLNKTGIEPLPVAIYGIVLFLAGIAYSILQWRIIVAEGDDSRLKQAIGSDLKSKVSQIAYAVAVGVAFWLPVVSVILFTAIAMLWLIPDRRIEKTYSAP